MPECVITVAQLEAICRQAAIRQPAAMDCFQPTANQIYFFTLVWLLKRKVAFQQAEDCLDGWSAAALRDHTRQVAGHLETWGTAVTGLKQREDIEWELLRIQMEKVIKHYDSPPDLKDGPLQKALLKIFIILNKMCDGGELDETQDIVTLVINTRTSLTNIYDFSSPFYPFAKRIARNELMTRLREEKRQPVYPLPLEELTSILPTVPPPSLPAEEEALLDTRPLQLKIDLTKLLEIIQHELTPKPRQVITHTLAAQPQFWLALKITGLSKPDNFPEKVEFASDEEIGRALGMTANSARVHRANAKRRAQEIDPMLNLLLETLITRRGGG